MRRSRTSSRCWPPGSPTRKFDFSLDYEVINELARRIYVRARIEPVKSPERREYLEKTIAAYRRTLAIDSEDVAAHYGLGLAYGDPAWRADAPTDRADRKPTTAGRSTRTLVEAGRDDRRSRAGRAPSARRERSATGRRRRPVHGRPAAAVPVAARAAARHRRDPGTGLGSPRPTPDARARWPAPWRSTHKRPARAAQARRDGRGPGFAAARKKDPAANQNAQSIVIHSLHRARCAGDRSARRQGHARFAASCDPESPRPPRTPQPAPENGDEARSYRIATAVLALRRFCRWPAPAADRGVQADGRRRARGTGPAGRRQARDHPDVKFVDVTEESGIHFRPLQRRAGEKLLPETMGAGVAFLDYDGDGDQDLFFVNSSTWPGHEVKPPPTQALYRNDGKGHFEDVTKAAGLDKTFYGQGVAVGDYDNDGDQDLYVTAVGGGHLFRNDGKGHFEDVTESVNATRPEWLAHRRRVPGHRERRRPRPVRRQLHHLVARDRQGPGIPAHRPRAGPTARRPRSAARSARCCGTTAASSSISASPRACRCGRPT